MDTKKIVEQIHQIHDEVENAYLHHPAIKTDSNWLEKRKLLLADLSLHMVHATLQDPVDNELIQRYLYSILIISHDFLPEAKLLETAERIVPAAAPI